MVQTAFQPNAFQNNAFQIGSSADTHDGVGGGWIKKRLRKKIKKIREEYEEIAAELLDNPHLLSAVDSYVDPRTVEEKERRAKAQYILPSPPPSSRIDFIGLYNNIAARERLLKILGMLKEQLASMKVRYLEEEEMMLMLLLGIE